MTVAAALSQIAQSDADLGITRSSIHSRTTERNARAKALDVWPLASLIVGLGLSAAWSIGLLYGLYQLIGWLFIAG